MIRAPLLGRTLLAALVLGVVSSPMAMAQSAEELVASGHVRIRHRLEPAEPVYVGQPVRLWIEVMTKTWFSEAPRYPATLEVPKAIVIPPESFGVNSTERIGGETYAVQGRAFTVFPQTTGTFAVPAVEVELVVARDDASRSPRILLNTEPVTLEARMPSGAEGHGLVLSTPRLTVEERYSREPEGLRVGESFERRVTTTIDDSVAMLLPPTEFVGGDGIAVYPARPEVTDTRNRGRMSGTRVDGATYVMEAEGSYLLPAMTIYWWNLRTSQLEEEVLPPVEFTVVANPDLAAEHLGEPELEEATVTAEPPAEEPTGIDWRLVVVGVVAVTMLLAMLRRFRQKLGLDKEMSESPQAVEAEHFRRFQRAARHGDPQATYASLVAWLDRLSPEGPVSARQFLDRVGDDELTRRYDLLVRRLYCGDPGEESATWSGAKLARAVERGRKVFLRRVGQQGPVEVPLPPLNPVAE